MSRFILNHHIEKAKLYENDDSKIYMTQIVGKINVGTAPMKPKKESIVTIGLLSGLILGIFLAFFLEFIQKIRTPRE